jgi:hypothetical protein
MRRIGKSLIDGIIGGKPPVEDPPPPTPEQPRATQEEDFIELPAVAIIVCMDAYLRLTRKGMPVDMPSELVEEETGITWKSVVPDFRTREIILLEIHDPYDLKAKKTIEHRIASDRFRTLLV